MKERLRSDVKERLWSDVKKRLWSEVKERLCSVPIAYVLRKWCVLYAVCYMPYAVPIQFLFTPLLYSPASPPASSPAFSPSYHTGNALSLFGRYSIFPMGSATITGIDEKLCEVRGARTRLTNVQVKDES